MKILFLPMDAHGHINACIGMARYFRKHGHECTFLMPTNWFGLVKIHKFKCEPLDLEGADLTADPLILWANYVRKIAPSFRKLPADQMRDTLASDMKEIIDYVKKIDDRVEDAIKKLKPDLIVVDYYVTVPAVVNSEKPWVLLRSSNPLYAYNNIPNAPPHHSGLGATDDPELMRKFREIITQEIAKVKPEADVFLNSKQCIPHETELVSPSPYMNVYSYPEELDYSELGPPPDTWFRLDHLVREPEGPIGFDESFLKGKTKIIYFSLGSMGSVDVALMNRLTSFMSETKYRYVVSTGATHDEIQLYPNMVGGRYLNQIKILPKVDLVITHGGNNTFVETLYFGKPVIVLPLFGDQHDNARRAIDKKVGKAFGPYQVTKEQLLAGIDEILEDSELLHRVKKIGEKMRASKRHKQCVDKLKELVNAIQESFRNYYVLMHSAPIN